MKLLAVGMEREQMDSMQPFLADIRIDPSSTASGSEVIATLTRDAYDAVLARDRFDDMSAFDLIASIREQSAIPIVMIGADDDEIGRVVGLEVGADDYVCSRCAPRELAARLRAVLRRATIAGNGTDEAEPLQAGDLVLDRKRREVHIGEQPASLTAAEFRMLEKLLLSRGEPVTRDALAIHALGRRLAINDRSIDTHMSRLRRKLGPMHNGEPRIQSVRGFGYFIADGDGVTVDRESPRREVRSGS